MRRRLLLSFIVAAGPAFAVDTSQPQPELPKEPLVIVTRDGVQHKFSVEMALTPDQANALARRTIVPGKLVWVVVGDMSKVEAGIRDLKLGEVRKIDADGNLLP